MTEAVNQLTSLHNTNKFTERSTAEPENSYNSYSGEDDEENDRRNRVTIHETDCSLYNKTNLTASCLSHLETSSSSVATIGKPDDDHMMGVVRPIKTGENRHLRR